MNGKYLFLLLIGLLLMPSVYAGEKNKTSINLHWAKDYMTPIFADAMMTRRDFEKLAFGSGSVSVDKNGWPLEDAGVVVWHGFDHRSGVYRLSFDGSADISAEWTSVEIRNKKYDPESDKTTAELYFAKPGNALRLKFTNTKQGSVFVKKGISNVKLMRPIAEGSETSHDINEVFDRNLKAVLSRFDVVRYMDPTETNSSPLEFWEDRVLPEQSQAKGMSWEYVIRLSNETGTDPWINIPHKAVDRYVMALAELFRDMPLNPDRKLYVEYSNEVWNTGPGFSQGGWNADEAVRYVQIFGKDDPLNYDGAFTSETAEQEKWTLAKRRVALRGAQVSDIFRSTFGDEQMMQRIRPVFCWQASGGNMNDWGLAGLNYIDGYLRTVQNRSVKDVFWGGGPAGYYSPADNATLDNIWDSNDFDPQVWAEKSCKYDATMCAAFGLHYVLYEGGPGFGDALGGSGSNPIGDIVWNDPRIFDEMIEHHQAYNKKGGELFCYYVLNHDYRWKFISSVDSADTYKMKAIDALRSSDRDLCEMGRRLPVTIKGGDFDAHKVGWKLNNSGQHDRTKGYNLPSKEWISYNILHSSEQKALMTIRYKATSSTKLLVCLGGDSITTLDIKAGSEVQTAPRIIFDMPADALFALRLVNEGENSMTIEDIEVKDNDLSFLTLQSQPDNGGILTGENYYEANTVVEIKAEPADGFAFNGWYDGDKKISDNTDYSYTVTKSETLTAKFVPVNEFPEVRIQWLEYHHPSCSWEAWFPEAGYFTSFVVTKDNMVLNGRTYKKFLIGDDCSPDSEHCCIGGIRQWKKRIYFKPVEPSDGNDCTNSFDEYRIYGQYDFTDGKEILLYDFSLEKGDTIAAADNSYGGKLTALEVDSIEIGGKLRKRIFMSCEYNGDDVWVEGIGSVNGPLKSFLPIPVCWGYMQMLSSMDEDGNRFYVYGPPFNESEPYEKDCLMTLVDDIQTSGEYVTVTGNKSVLTIRFSSDNWKTLSLFDTKGSLLVTKNIAGVYEYTLPMSSYVSGVYVLLFSNEKMKKTVKVRIE
ncbi:MAG: T9SS type A sorting domain-containing protein [Bacteroidales bacterium]|nr:T9SS type A sorting domain-containing protein [Bacteroidales bacterium]